MTILTFVWRGCAGCWEGEQVLHQQRLAGLAWPGEAAGPGLSGGHSGQASEAREREQLSVQPRQSARAERPSQTECHDQRHRVTRPVTLPSLSSASVTHEPVRSPRGQVRRRSEVSTSEARGQSPTPVSQLSSM